MKRILLIISIVAVAAMFSACKADIFTVYAQSLPVTKTAAWNANPVSDAVINYTLRLDGIVVNNNITSTTQQFTITTAGAHVLTLTATNQWGTSPATTLNFNVVIPAAPAGLSIQ